MQHEPCGLLSDADSLGDFIGTDAILTINEHPESTKPLVELNGGILKDGSQLYGELLPALFALPTLLSRKIVVILMSASGTGGLAIGPAKLGYGVNTGLLIGVVPDGLLECLGAVHDGKVADSPWLVK